MTGQPRASLILALGVLWLGLGAANASPIGAVPVAGACGSTPNGTIDGDGEPTDDSVFTTCNDAVDDDERYLAKVVTFDLDILTGVNDMADEARANVLGIGAVLSEESNEACCLSTGLRDVNEVPNPFARGIVDIDGDSFCQWLEDEGRESTFTYIRIRSANRVARWAQVRGSLRGCGQDPSVTERKTLVARRC